MATPKRPAGAPARAPTSNKRRGQWEAGYKGRTLLLEKIEQMKKAAKFYDPSSAGTRKRRANILRDFEDWAEEYLGLQENAVWNKNTIIDHQMQYIAGLAAIAKGVFNEKVKVGTLYETKYAFYWWNALFIDDFGVIYHKWHVTLMKWIHQIATEFQLSTAAWKKNNLTDTELSMFFRVVMDAATGVENLVQHYACWVLAWVTAARPGSLTLAPGYTAKDTLPNGSERGFDQTLRWEDIEWFKDGGRICFRLTLKYQKGSRDPYASDFVDPTRTFLFLPLESPRLELDLTLVLLGLAIKRGLFTLDYVLETDHVFLKPEPAVNKQAVFVAADKSGGIMPEIPMGVDALNHKLREACLASGLPQRNTMYSWRRTGLSETMRDHSTEEAKQLANHSMQSEVLRTHYDSVGMGDIDIQGWRLGTSQMSRKEISTKFRQGYQTVFETHNDTYQNDLRAERDTRVEELLRTEREYVEVQETVKSMTDEVRTFLEQEIGRAEEGDERTIPRGYSGQVTGAYKAMLGQMDTVRADELLSQYHAAFYTRKVTLQRVRKRLRNVALDEIAAEMKSLLKDVKKVATSGLKTKGGAPKKTYQQSKEVHGDLENYTRAQLDSIAALRAEIIGDDAVEDQDGVDIEALNAHEVEKNQNSRAAPAEWDAYAEGVDLRVEIELQDDDEKNLGNNRKPSEQDRLAFLKAIINKTSRPTSNLQCWRCVADMSSSEKARNKKWPRSLLNTHLKSVHHTRRAQLRRAFDAYKKASSLDKLPCNLCAADGIPKEYRDSGNWLKHIKKHHPEELWENDEGENSESDSVDEQIDSDDAQENEEDDAT